MGRKKKTEEQPSQNNIKEIEVKSNTPISYHGSVEIKIKKSNKIISNRNKRNKAGQQMIYYLVNCLAGKFLTNLAPKYIVLFNKADNLNTKLSQLVAYREVNTSDSVTAYYNFIIPYNAIISSSMICNRLIITNEESKNNIIDELAENNIYNYSNAIIDLTGSDVTTTSPIDLSNLGEGDAILIKWSMTIDNSTNEGGNN